MTSPNNFEKVDPDEITPLIKKPSDGYSRRRQTDRDGRFIQPDQGSFLGIDRDINQPELLGDSPEVTDSVAMLETPTSLAINMCQEKVLKPYRVLLLSVGWSPVFEEAESVWQKAVNVIHPLIVMLLVILGYIIQYACCFRRDSSGTIIHKLVNVSVSDYPNGTEIQKETYTDYFPTCGKVAISQYLIPDLLHSAAYIYSFYILRFKQTENLTTLTTRTFLQTSMTQRGFWSQGKLIRTLRVCLYLSVLWVLLSISSQVIHAVAMYSTIRFKWFHPGENDVFAKILLIVFMLISFVALDVVYVLVVLNYCVQSLLIIFFIQGLQHKVTRREYGLKRAMQEISEVQDHLKVLNYNTGLALSIVLFNFGTMAVLGFIELFAKHVWANPVLMYISTGLSVFFWMTILIIPFVQAARLSAACASMKKLGHEIRAKAYAYQNVAAEELDSFLLFTSTLNMRAKIFLLPIKTSYLSFVTVTLSFVLLLLFQMGVLDLEIY